MTELQVKTKKGSLKKFLAMFLAVCVCMTTFQLNGMFAAAENDPSGSNVVTPEKAKFVVSGDEAHYEVESGTNLNSAQYLTVSPGNASRKMIDWTKSDASPSDASITVDEKGVVTGEEGASATITITVPGTAIEDSCTVKITGGQTSTETPTPTPTQTQTPTPTKAPTQAPTKVPTKAPTKVPTKAPTQAPTKAPTQAPTKAPTKAPVKVKKVTLSATKLYVVAKKSVTVGVSVEPSDAKTKTVTWKSKNTKVATVKNGKITAKNAAGKDTKITATAKDGSKKSATVTVYVVKKAVKVSSVKLPKTAKVDVKGTVALKTTIKPAKATMDSKTLKWSTSDKKVATVANGVVTGKKAGVATITVKAGKKSAKCVVTVTKKGVKAKLQKTKATVKVKKTFQIKLKGKGDSIVDCKTSNKKIATVTKKGKITGKKAGKADITVITKKGGVATFKVTVKK